jgi:hypothetical protein
MPSICKVNADLAWSHLVAISNIYVHLNHNCIHKTNPQPYHYPYTNHRYLIDEMADKVSSCICYIQRNKARVAGGELRYTTLFPLSRKKQSLTGKARCTIVLPCLLFSFLPTSNTTQLVSNTIVFRLCCLIFFWICLRGKH